jgi:hypothetical protein
LGLIYRYMRHLSIPLITCLKNFGMCYYFLRIEVTKLSDGVIRTQGKYVLDLLKGLFGTALLQLL